MPKQFVPGRNHIIWLDFEPKKGKEIGKYRPAFVLSSQEYNKKTGLLICCPINTSIRGHLSEVQINNLDTHSVIATSIIQTLSWQERKAKFITNAESDIYYEVITRIIPFIGANQFFN